MKSVTFLMRTESVQQLGSMLSITTDMGLVLDLSLIPKLCYFSPASRSDRWIRSTSRLKTRLATHSFGPERGCSSPVRIITLRALTSLRKQRSSASHVLFNIARQRRPLGPETVIWPCLTASNHDICHFYHTHETCPSVGLRAQHNNVHGTCTRSFLDT